jgi:hypothetical protein
MLGIDIYVMRLTNKGLSVHLNTSVRGVVRKAVVISGNGNHYETVGIERNGLFQTVFDQTDPFIIALRLQIDDEGGTEIPLELLLTHEEMAAIEQDVTTTLGQTK